MHIHASTSRTREFVQTPVLKVTSFRALRMASLNSRRALIANSLHVLCSLVAQFSCRCLVPPVRRRLGPHCSISLLYFDLGPGSPPDWSVFMWRIELTCGSPFGRLLPSCISVLSFYRLYFGGYSIFMIARSIDPAPLPSDNISTMGPGFAVVGTPGFPSDVARTKVLLPRL